MVDAGFSFTHALPFFDGQLLPGGVKRINLGGKALTNYFKELVSYRCFHLPLAARSFASAIVRICLNDIDTA